MDELRPKLLDVLKDIKGAQLLRDIVSGVIVAIILALKGKGLMTVALAASITVFLVSLIPGLI